MAKQRSRYEEVSRRAVLKGSLGLGVVTLIPGLACGGGDDATVFAGANAARSTPTPIQSESPTPTPASTPTPTTDNAAANAAEPPAATEPAATPTEVPTAEPTSAPINTSALPAGAMMAIDFSYVQGRGGKNLPPYIAVWIEDSAGDLVQTIELWYQQDRKGKRWLPDLKRWNTVDQQRISAGGTDLVDVISSATRIAGSYSIGWDGSLEDGTAGPGDYFLCIEASRERGPYSLIREPLTLDGSLFELQLPDEGELQAASVSVSA